MRRRGVPIHLKRVIALLVLLILPGLVFAVISYSTRLEKNKTVSMICKENIGTHFVSFCLPQVNYKITSDREICIPDFQKQSRTILVIYYNFCPSCRLLLQNYDQINRNSRIMNTRIIAYSWGNSEDGDHIDDTATYRCTMDLIDSQDYSLPFVLNRQDLFMAIKSLLHQFPKPAVLFLERDLTILYALTGIRSINEESAIIMEFDRTGKISKLTNPVATDTIITKREKSSGMGQESDKLMEGIRLTVLNDVQLAEMVRKNLPDPDLWVEQLLIDKEFNKNQMIYSLFGKLCDCPDQDDVYSGLVVRYSLDSSRIVLKKVIEGKPKTECLRLLMGEIWPQYGFAGK